MSLRRGCVLRDYVSKRVKNYPEVDEPMMCWYRNMQAKTLVIVEDQLSALKCSRFYESVALLGVGLNTDKVVEIANVMFERGIRKSILLLDEDAYTEALKKQMRWSSVLEGLVVENSINKDPKYWDNDSLKMLGEE